ncbi:TPA: hypothetical protein ACH3X2_006202 [Trebouxia sp. C0005]
MHVGQTHCQRRSVLSVSERFRPSDLEDVSPVSQQRAGHATQLKRSESPEVIMISSSSEELLRMLPKHAKSASTTARKELRYDSEGLSSTPSRGTSPVPGFSISPDRTPRDRANDGASSLPSRHQEGLQTGPLFSRPGSGTGMTAAVSARQLLSRAHAKTVGQGLQMGVCL